MLGATLNPRQFLDRVAAELARIDTAEVQKLADLIHERYAAGRFVFVIRLAPKGVWHTCLRWLPLTHSKRRPSTLP